MGLPLATTWQGSGRSAHGAPRVLMTASLLDPRRWEWLRDAQEDGFKLLCWADSRAAVEAMADFAALDARPVRVLIESGRRQAHRRPHFSRSTPRSPKRSNAAPTFF